MVENFDRNGWALFAEEQALRKWAGAARVAGQAALLDPAYAHWHQCGGTWFVGVDALPNDPSGQLADFPLKGTVLDFIAARFGAVPPLHRAQVSVVFPGYPKPRAGESAAAFLYRRNRDAAHVDGIRAEGPTRARYLREPHNWILGLPLNAVCAQAAPLVVWDGSHRIMGKALAEALRGVPTCGRDQHDITKVYQQARKEVFEKCARRPLSIQPGGAVLLHPLLLHGIAPWPDDHLSDAERMVAYFRPEAPGGIDAWLALARMADKGAG